MNYNDLSELAQDEVQRDIDILSDNDLDRLYADMLDECYEPARIGDLEYLPSEVLQKCDPIAWRCGLADWMDSEGLVEFETGYAHESDIQAAVDSYLADNPEEGDDD